MAGDSPLDDPDKAAYAWAHYRRIMRLVGIITVVVVAAAMLAIFLLTESVSIHFYIASALGIGFTMLLGGALMGLVFLSSGTGHDEAVGNGAKDRD